MDLTPGSTGTPPAPSSPCSVRTRRALRLAVACALVTGGAVAAPASASVVSMAADHSITVIPTIDMVVVSTPNATDIGKIATVEVTRGGAVVARARGPLVAGEDGVGSALEVNHGPEGTPAPGDCWAESAANDIVQVGDHVVFSVDDVLKGRIIVDQMTLSAARADGPDRVSLVLTIVKKDGTAATDVDGGYRDDGLAAGRFRAAATVTPLTATTWELSYAAPLYGQRASDSPISPSDARAALLTGTGHTAMFGHAEEGVPPEVQMIEGADDPGPAAGCPAPGPVGPGGSPTDKQPPTMPTGLTATAATSARIDLRWEASRDNVGVTGYEVLRAGVVVGTPTGTTFNETGLNPDTTYTYRVRAVDAAGNRSDEASATAKTPPRDTPPPPKPTVSISDRSAKEGNGSGLKTFHFRVALSAASSTPVTVRYTTEAGPTNPATPGVDFHARTADSPGTVTIPAGVLSSSAAVSVVRDRVREPHETFTVVLSGASGATIADGAGVATIRNDDRRR